MVGFSYTKMHCAQMNKLFFVYTVCLKYSTRLSAASREAGFSSDYQLIYSMQLELWETLPAGCVENILTLY